MIDYKKIRPKVKGKSDFFSWKLSEHIRNNPDMYRVYKWDDCLYIGAGDVGDWIHAQRLRALCSYAKKPTTFAYCKTKEWEEITNQFWKDYLEKGVCAIHTDIAHEWKELAVKKRQCEYCGKIETRKVKVTKSFVWN